jgi:hypothetical protein
VLMPSSNWRYQLLALALTIEPFPGVERHN